MAIVEGSGGAKTTKKNTANIFDNINKQIEAQKNNLNTTGSVYSSQGNTGYANENAKSKVLTNVENNNFGNKVKNTDTSSSLLTTKNVAKGINDLGKTIRDTAKTSLGVAEVVVAATNKVRSDNGVKAPIAGIIQKASNLYDNVSTSLLNNAKERETEQLGKTFSAKYGDTSGIIANIKSDPNYASNLVNDNGLVDHSETINLLKNQISTETNRDKKSELQSKLKQYENYQKDQEKLLYNSYYKTLIENGASQDEINEFERYAIKGEKDLAERLLTNLGGSVEGYLGNQIRGLEALKDKANWLAGGGLPTTNNSTLGDYVIDNAERLQSEALEGASGVEKVMYEIYNSSAPSYYALATSYALGGAANYIGNREAAAKLVGNSLYFSDLSVFGNTIHNNLKNGYDFDTSFDNALGYAAASHISEEFGGETVVDMLAGDLSVMLLNQTSNYIIQSVKRSMFSEAIEEGFESALDLGIDSVTTNKNMTLKEYMTTLFSKDTAYEMLIGGLAGAIGGGANAIGVVVNYNNGVNELAKTINIDSEKTYNQFSEFVKDQNNMQKQLANTKGVQSQEVYALGQLSKAYQKKMIEYRKTHQIGAAITSSKDTNVVTAEELGDTLTMQKVITPDVQNDINDVVNLKKYVNEQSINVAQMEQENLEKAGATIKEIAFEELDQARQEEIKKIESWIKPTNRKVAYANLIDNETGDVIDGFYDKTRGLTVINPNAKTGMITTLVHEFTHGAESSLYYQKLKKLAEEYRGGKEEFKKYAQYIQGAYGTYINLDMDGAYREAVAKTTQDLLGNQDFVDRLVQYDSSLAYRLYDEIKYMNSKNDIVGDIEQTFKRAFIDKNNYNDVIKDTNNNEYYTYDNLTKLDDIKVNQYKLSSFSEINNSNKKDIFSNALNNAINNGCDIYTDKSFGVVNNIDNNIIYANSGMVKHGLYGANNSYTITAIENVYDLLKTAIPINKSYEIDNKGNKIDFINYFNAYNDGNDTYIVNINVKDGTINEVSSVIYSVGTKKGSIPRGSTTNNSRLLMNSSFNLSINDLLQEINNNDIYKNTLPRDVQIALNGNLYPGDGKHITKFSKALSNETDNENSQLSNGQVEYFKDSKLRDDNGKLVKLYHTSKKLFTEFNPVGSERYRFGNNVVNYYSTNKDVSGSYNRGKYNQVDTDTFINDVNIEETVKKLKKQIDDIKILKDNAWDKFNGAAIHYFDKYGYDFNDLYGNLKYLPLESFTNNLKGDKDLAEGSKYIMSIVENLSRVNNADENLNVNAFVESSMRVLEVYEKMVGDNNYNIGDRYGKETSDYLLSNKTKELFENVKADLKNIWQLGDEHSDLRGKYNSLNKEYDKLLSNGYQYSGYGLSSNPYIIDGNLSNWNSLNNSNYYLDTNEINNVASEVVDIIGNITDTEILDAKWKVNDYILKNVSDNTKQYLIDNPIVLANLSNYAKDLYSTRNYSFGKNLKERMIEKIGYQFESNAGVRQVGSDRYNITKFGDNLETNDVVKAVIAINQYLESQGNDAKYDGVVFNNIYDTGSGFDVKANVPSDIVALFNSNQFKSDFNLTPTSKSDIRFSKADNKINVYHGTPNDFENYDMSLSGANTNNHSGEKGVIWFTNDKDVAKQYSYEQTPTNSMFVNNVGKQGTVREETITLNNPVDLRNLINEQAQIIADNDDFNYSVEQLIEESKAPNSQLIKTHINENTINALKAAGYDGFVNEYDPTKYPNVLEYGVFDIKQISNNKANKKVNYDKQLVDLLSNPYDNDELREYLKNKYNKSDENIEKAIILRDSLNVSNNDQLDYEKSLQKLSREIVDNKTVVKGLTDEQIADFNNLTPTNKYTSGLSTEDSKVVTKARKMIKQQMVDKSRRLNVKNELNQVVADIYQTGDITEQTYNSLREKIVDSTLIKVPNDEYGIKTDIINNYMNGTPFLKKDGWDNTIQEIQDKYNVFAQDNYPLTYEDAKNSLKDFFDSIGDKYIYYTPVQMGMMSQGDYDNMLINTVADVINELKFNINNVDMDDKALVEFTNERLSSKEANLIDKLLINDTLGNNDYVNNVLDYIRRNNTNQEVMEGAISSSEDSLQDLIKNESKYIDTIVEKDGIASLPTETLDKMEADSLEYITLDKVKDQETKVLENQKYKKKGTNLKEDINKMKQKIIDRGQAIYDLGRKTKSDIYAYYNNYRNAASMADYKLYQDKNNWVDIIKKIPKDQQNDFSYMMYHWLNTDTYKYKKPVFGDITDIQSQQIVDQYLKEHPDWKDVAQKVWDYEKDLREELVKHGRISRQTADTWEEMYPHYVHIVRDSVNVEEVPNVLETEQEKVKSSNKGTVKERTGGNSALKSLNDAIVEQTKQVYSATTMNDFINRYVQVAKPKVQVWEDFQDRTIEGIDRSIGNEIQAPDENTPATFIFYDNGDTRTIEVPANIYDAFVAEKVMDNVVTDVLSKANEIRRNLITSQNITFAARNIIKDTQDVLLKSEHPTLTYTMMPKAAVDMATNSETYQLYRSMGGGRNNATKVTEGSKIYNNTIGMVERGNNFVETLPRYAEFKASLASGRTPIQAMYDADKVTTNFKMGGDYTKFADRNGFTFLNASVEGFTELARDYQSVYDKKGWKGVLGKLAMATLVFNVPLMVANHLRWKDDEDYQNLSDYVKDNYYILWKNSDGSFTRINKGRVAAAYQAIISTLWENGVELVSDDSATEKAKFMWENSLDGLERVWDNIGINNPLKNNIVSPIIDVMKNETWYGEDLLSEYQLKKDASEQYDYTTDALSKWIGQNTNTSPIKWNYLLEQYSGGIGDIVLPTLTPKTETNLDDGTALGKVESALLSPIVDDFTVDPVFKNQNVSDLFDLDTELSKRASKDSATDEEKIASKYISNIKYQMFKLYGERADIFNDETLTDAEKYRQARLIQGQINELAKYGLNTYDNIDMSGGYTQVGDLSYYKNSQNEWEKVNADTIEEMESLGMTTDQRNTYYQLKEEITSNNQVQTLLGYYDSLEELKNSNKYSTSMKKNKISELEEKIKKAESKFTSEELAQIKKDGTINARTNNYEAIKSSNLSDEQKNYMYDKYYSSNLNEYINELDISDSEKLDLKYTTSQVEGKKNAKGKTISNSKALAMADAYADAGVLDDVFAYIKENNLDPSDFGLSKKVYNYSYKQLENAYKNIFGQDFGTGDTIEDTSVIDSSYYGTSGSSSSSTDKARKKQLKAMKAYMNAITSANKNIFSYLNNMTSIEDAKSNVEKIKSKYKV